jgi:hypothetical protein
MRHDRLLELIWQGEIQPASGPRASRLQRGLGALLPLRAISLSASSGVDRRCILTDATELMPDLPLGDVLAEELSIDVPVGSLVVISDAVLLDHPVMDDELSYDLGVLVAEALLGVIRRGVFPYERESDALFTMASSYHAMIGGSGFMHFGMMPSWFRVGLAAGLCTFWAGARSARSDTSGLFLRPDFLTCPKLHDYLRNMDSNFTMPDRIPAGLMLFTGGPCDYDTWLSLVEQAVTVELDAHVMRICGNGRPQEQRA